MGLGVKQDLYYTHVVPTEYVVQSRDDRYIERFALVFNVDQTFVLRLFIGLLRLFNGLEVVRYLRSHLYIGVLVAHLL